MKGDHVWFYRAARAVVLRICVLAFRVRIRGRANVPKSGAYVLAPSHRSVFDIVFLGYVTPRRIRFMGKKEWWSVPVLGALFTALGAFPVDRDATDRSALKAALAAVDNGEPVAIFPEGTRGSGAELGPLFEGPAYVALKRGVPIVPVGIGGSEAILPSGVSVPRLRRAAVVIGEPIFVEKPKGAVKRSELTRVTEALRVSLQAAFTEAEELAEH